MDVTFATLARKTKPSKMIATIAITFHAALTPRFGCGGGGGGGVALAVITGGNVGGVAEPDGGGGGAALVDVKVGDVPAPEPGGVPIEGCSSIAHKPSPPLSQRQARVFDKLA